MRVFTLLLLIISVSEGFGQFSIEAFLSAAVNDAELEEVRRQQEYFDTHSFASPWVRDVEVRARYRDREAGLEDYRLRLGLLNPFEMAANKSYKSTLGDHLQIKKEVKLNDILEGRYLLLIEHLTLSQQVSLLEDEIAYTEKLKSIVGDLKLADQQQEWISLEEDGLDLELKKEELLGKLGLVNFLIGERMNFSGTINWEAMDLISLDELSVAFLKLEGDTSSLYLDEAASDYLLAQKEFRIEKAQSRSNIGYIQAEYEKDPSTEFTENLGFQFGVAIPVFNKDRPDLQREELDLIEAEAEWKEVKTEQGSLQRLQQIEIEYLMKQARIVEERIVRFEELSKPDSGELFDVGQYKRSFKYRHRLMEKRLEFYAQLLELYIRRLHDQGLLAQSPFVNYLSK